MMPSISHIVLSRKGKGVWIKRFILLFAVLALFWAGYRACRWAVPPTPSVYKIGMDTTWYPLSLYGQEYNFTTFSSDLLFMIAKQEHFQVEIMRTGFKRLMDLLDDGLVDGVLTSITPDEIAEERYYFSEPYYRFGAVLVVRKDFDFSSLKSLPNKRIGVKRGSSILYHTSIDPSVSIIPYDSSLMALDDLVRDRVDGVIMDQLLAYNYFGGAYRNQLKVATLPLTLEGLRLVTLQESYAEELIEKFNKGLKKLQEDGIYEKLLLDWDLYNPEKLY